MKLTVVIVNYNVKYYLAQCLQSLQKSLKGIESEVVVIDNHSHDGSVKFLRQHFPWVRVVASQHNLGFARANNAVIRMCHSDYVLLLNPDTIVAERTIADSLLWMDAHSDAGALGVRMLTVSGDSAKESRRGLPTPLTAFYKMTGLCDRFPLHHKLGHYYMGYLPWDEPAQIEIVSGAYCMLRSEALDKVGLLDESFFMYGEDIDLSYRVLKGGYHNYYIPSLILHYKGESTHKSSFNYVHVFYEAMLIFFRKHYKGMSLLLSIPINVAIYFRATIALVQMMVRRIRKSLGFFSIKRLANSPIYVLIGSKDMIAACKDIATKVGLELDSCFEGDSKTFPMGHLSDDVLRRLENLGSHTVCIVYDADSYSYEKIFHRFMSHPNPLWKLGTYTKEANRIITDKEVIY